MWIDKDQYVVVLGTAPSAAMDIFTYLILIVIASLSIGVVGYLIRRRLRHSDTADSPQAFSLADLRRLRDEGQLSEHEYERARGAVVAEGLAVLHTPGPAGGSEPPDLVDPAEQPGGASPGNPSSDDVGSAEGADGGGPVR